MEREELIRRVTEEVIRRLAGGAPPAPAGTQPPAASEGPAAAACSPCVACGLCVDRRPGAVASIIASGASRVSAASGVADFRRDLGSLASVIDHTLLKPAATRAEVEELCAEAARYGFASVCVNPCHVPLCAELLRPTNVKVCTVVGFPLGANKPEVKAFEAERAIADGAHELDMVANIGAIKAGDHELVERDIRGVVRACGARVVLKVIIEAALLTDEEKVAACNIAKKAGADFVKTSTGFAPGGATAHDVRLMRAAVGREMGVKAAGGIRDLDTAREMVEAGASRIGASASVKIVGG
ncbi:MAG: deoxyribose-phosphate aldolase [Candidatus Eisenbacteria bacterium]|nr:deoxyribose-phosphate aldolase [Candidatus Eisenbacteria bacterium]